MFKGQFMKARYFLATLCGTTIGLFSATVVAHNYLVETQAPAGYVHDIAMRVPHGCQGSPVQQVRIKIPDGVYRVTAEHRQDWEVTLKMRKVDPPVPGDGGRPITETVDEIVWSNAEDPLPANRTGEFRFRAKLPDQVGTVLYFRTLNNCVEGDDNYVDLPVEELRLDDPEFHAKFWAFMTATATPAPYLILTKPERPQYPWEVGEHGGSRPRAARAKKDGGCRLVIPWRGVQPPFFLNNNETDRFMIRCMLLVCLAACLAVAFSSQVLAHAVLLGSNPQADQVLDSAPEEIVLNFNENVGPIFIRLLDLTGSEVGNAAEWRIDGNDVYLPLGDTLPNGTYILTYRVISADTHPVGSTFVFAVGEPLMDASAVASADSGSTAWTWAVALNRLLLYGSVLLAAGSALFLLLMAVSPNNGQRHQRPGAHRRHRCGGDLCAGDWLRRRGNGTRRSGCIVLRSGLEPGHELDPGTQRAGRHPGGITPHSCFSPWCGGRGQWPCCSRVLYLRSAAFS